MKKLIATVCAIALFAACKRTIDGQVFVRTNGAGTVKLSLVDVALFDARAIAEDVERKRKAAEPIYEALQPFAKEAEKGEKVSRMALYLHSAPYYFNDPPKPLQMTKTDADGKFTFKIPNGAYVLAAASSRQAGMETEFYHWMVKVKVDADEKVMLANDNLSTSGSPDSMIATTVIDGDDLKSVEGVSLASIEALIEEKKEDREKEAQKQKRIAEQVRAYEARGREDREKEAQEKKRSAEWARDRELAEYRENPKAARQKAVELYPALGFADSPLNKEFVARMKRYQSEKKEFFAEPDWPIRLAKECNDDLSAKQPAKQ